MNMEISVPSIRKLTGNFKRDGLFRIKNKKPLEERVWVLSVTTLITIAIDSENNNVS